MTFYTGLKSLEDIGACRISQGNNLWEFLHDSHSTETLGMLLIFTLYLRSLGNAHPMQIGFKNVLQKRYRQLVENSSHVSCSCFLFAQIICSSDIFMKESKNENTGVFNVSSSDHRERFDRVERNICLFYFYFDSNVLKALKKKNICRFYCTVCTFRACDAVFLLC